MLEQHYELRYLAKVWGIGPKLCTRLLKMSLVSLWLTTQNR